MHNGDPRRRRKKKVDQTCILRNYGWKLPNPKEGNRYSSTGNTEGSKQDEPRPTLRYVIIIIPKIKDLERILKAARVKQRVNYKGTPIMLSADLCTEMLQDRRGWQEVFKVLKGKNSTEDTLCSKIII